MPKFRKKPVVIDAELWTPGLEDCALVAASDGSTVKIFDNEQEATNWLEMNSHMGETVRPGIRTLEGAHTIDDGDWIITGVAGERYPCKPDIFEQTYEPATEQ